jgi:hypothetical protein
MFVYVNSVFVLSCVWVAALRRADPPSKESCRLCIELRKLKTNCDEGCTSADHLWQKGWPCTSCGSALKTCRESVEAYLVMVFLSQVPATN